MSLKYIEGFVQRKRVFAGRYSEAMNVALVFDGATCLAMERNGERYQPYAVMAARVDACGLFRMVNRFDRCVWEQTAEMATLDVIAEVALIILDKKRVNRYFVDEDFSDFLFYARARREKEELDEVAAEGKQTKRRRI